MTELKIGFNNALPERAIDGCDARRAAAAAAGQRQAPRCWQGPAKRERERRAEFAAVSAACFGIEGRADFAPQGKGRGVVGPPNI